MNPCKKCLPANDSTGKLIIHIRRYTCDTCPVSKKKRKAISKQNVV